MSRRSRAVGQVLAVLIVLAVSTGLVYAGGTPAEKCAAAKSKAASKKIASKLRCYQKALLAGTGVDKTCLTAIETKFIDTISKIDGKGGCVVMGDANAIEGAVEKCVDDIVALTPATTTTSTTSSTTTTTTLVVPPCTTLGDPCGSCGTGICSALCDATRGCALGCLGDSAQKAGCSKDDECLVAGEVCRIGSGTCPSACFGGGTCGHPCP